MERILGLESLLTWVILTFVSFNPADSLTSLMIPRNQTVPAGELFELKCVSRRILTNGSRVRNELYKVEGDIRSYLSPLQANACETNYTTEGPVRATVTTVFRLRASEDSAGRYGCLPILENATRPATFTAKQKGREVFVHICSEPELQVDRSHQTDGESISVTANERCGYKGELTWLVNGRQAPRRSTPIDDRFPVAERKDNSLEIRSTSGCLHESTLPCDVTAVYTYITTESRVRSVNDTVQITDCCVHQDVFLPAEVKPNEDTATEAPSPATEAPSPFTWPPHPLDELAIQRRQEADKHALEKEVLGLEKQVLQLKLEALPMQVKFLRRLNRDHSQGRDMERVGDI